jgi:hypothetical protein
MRLEDRHGQFVGRRWREEMRRDQACRLHTDERRIIQPRMLVPSYLGELYVRT